MKKILVLFTALLLLACESPKEVYETEIKTYSVSKKESYYIRPDTHYVVYFQTPTSTEKAKVNQETYDSCKVGDTIKVLIKYWEKPKNN